LVRLYPGESGGFGEPMKINKVSIVIPVYNENSTV